MNQHILQVNNLHVHYMIDNETIRAVNGVSFSLEEGETLGLVGETGAGKTTTAMSIMQLIPDPPGIVLDGDIIFQGRNLIYNTEAENQAIRGNGISMVFQDPMTALNPIMTIGKQMAEVIMTHGKASKSQAIQQSKDFLEIVGVRKDRFNDYPHQFSGGMKQRVVIAMALLCDPKVIIADEPTTALDVTIQAQVLDLISSLQKRHRMSMILITHNLGVVAETCDRVAIMYAGQIVESGKIKDVYLSPKHPYTRALFHSIPRIDEDCQTLIPIPGAVPNPAALPEGCFFNPRCLHCKHICRTEDPPERASGDHRYKCHFDF